SELAADAPAYAANLTAALSEAATYLLDEALLVGAGAAMPQGVLSSPALVTVAKETGQAAASIVYRNITRAWARLLPGSHNFATWVCSPSALPELLSLSIEVGTGGSAIPVMKETGGSMTLLGRPVIVSDKLPGLGEAGDLLLADFR